MKSYLLPPGTTAPDFTLPSHDGHRYTLRGHLGRTTLLIFYRGHWCGSCRRQLEHFCRDHQEFADRDVEVLAISAESVEQTRAAASEQTFPFPLLSDPGLEVISRYGVKYRPEDEGRDLARPAVFVVDRAGVIQFAYVGEDAGDRPALDVILLALDRLD